MIEAVYVVEALERYQACFIGCNVMEIQNSIETGSTEGNPELYKQKIIYQFKLFEGFGVFQMQT